MKHKTGELTGPLLDAAVAMAEGLQVASVDDIRGCQLAEPHPEHGTTYFMPQVWEQGGPIIDTAHMSVGPELHRGVWYGGWIAHRLGWEGQGSREGKGDTPLIAAMRAYVASKLGDEVEL
jgi:hypothetical protein